MQVKAMYQDILQELRRIGYKLTSQRKSIIKTLLENDEQHLSVEDIFELVKEDYPELGLTTVYRTVDLLEELGFLIQLNLGDGRRRFELKNQRIHQHHHLICLACGRVMECDEDLLDRLERNLARENRFEITDHSLKFYGYCCDCQ